MAGISDDKLQELRDRVDVVAVVQRRVPLKKSGRDLKGLCPFHGEKTPSFYVIPDKKIFHCFGCGKTGDAIKFVMESEGKSFREAVEQLALEAGIVLEQDDPEERKRNALRAALAEVNEKAATFFERVLWELPFGQASREHLEKRGITVETAKAWRLGYAPDKWDALVKSLEGKQKVDPKLIEQAGLGVPRTKGRGVGTLYDRFRGRLMIPIRESGRTVAFGGRHMEGQSEAKYLNSPETPLYQKGHTLFALDKAREAIRKEGIVLFVEGYFDAIGLHQAGVQTAVATCGTAMTERHVELVSRAGAKELVFVFDGDAAGIRASTRASEIAAAQGVPARVLVPPDGEDPDETVLRIGTAAFRDLVRAAQPALEFLLDRALADVGEGASIEARVKTVQAVSGIVKAAPPGLARELYVEKVAERLKAPVDAVRMAIERMPGPKGPDRQRPEPDPVEEFGDAPRAPPRAYEPRQGGNPQQNRQGQGQRGQEPQQPGQAMRQGGPNGAQQNSRDPRAPGPGSPGQRGMEPRTQNPQPSPNDAQQAKGYAPAPVVPPANRKVGLIDPRKAEAQAELSVVAQMLLHVDLCKLVDESGVAGEFRVAALREFAEGAFVAAREGMLDARALVAASEPELLRKALERSLDEAEKGRAEAPEQERTNLKNKLNRLKRQGFNVRNRRDAAEEVVGQRTTASADRPKSDQETGA